jgi:hypothetical protein
MWVTSMPQVWDEEARSGKGAAAGMVTPAPATALLGSLAGWLSRVADPPAPTVCGAPGGPPVTAPRVTLRDGRHLAYCESGVPKEEARFKVVFSHGFTGSREDSVRATQVLHLRPALNFSSRQSGRPVLLRAIAFPSAAT